MADPVGGSTPTPAETDLHLVEIVLCTPCMNGEGGECHSPGCALWMHRAPDLSLWDHPAVKRNALINLLRGHGVASEPTGTDIISVAIAAKVNLDPAARSVAGTAAPACCDLHGVHCEPPSELCCRECSEARHPEHPAGVPCVLPSVGLCDGCDTSGVPVQASDDGRGLFCGRCLPVANGAGSGTAALTEEGYRDLLGCIWLYVDWRYVTKQLTTEQKEMWADAVDNFGDPEDRGPKADRWWAGDGDE